MLPGAVVVMEWPDRAGDALPADRIDIALTLSAAAARTRAPHRPHGRPRRRAPRASTGSARMLGFLDEAGFGTRGAPAHRRRCVDPLL